MTRALKKVGSLEEEGETGWKLHYREQEEKLPAGNDLYVVWNEKLALLEGYQ